MRIVDLHCDTISLLSEKEGSLYCNAGHFDIKRALESKLALQFFALFSMPVDCNTSMRQILKQIDKFYLEMDKNSEYLFLARDYNDINKGLDSGKIACLLHLEGAEALGTDEEMLRILYRLGLRSIGLTWNNRNLLADGVAEGDQAGGLSLQGRQVLDEMSKLGIILDLSHISEKSFFDALAYYDKPVLVSHANARALCNHRRNLNDSQLRALALNGGVIGINQVADFVKEDSPTVDDLLDHIVYIADLIGVEHIGLGSDFDGADKIVMKGIEDYSKWESLLSARSFTQEEIEKILGLNALRVIESVLNYDA